MLALDAQDNPTIIYDGENLQECKRYPEDPDSNLTYVETKWWTTRLIYFGQP